MSSAENIPSDDDVVMLAIETSQRTGSVALRRGGTINSEPLQTKSRHDDDLLPAIDRLLRRSHIKPGDLTHVAVSIGPGGFTGLRIAVATAKMFAETLGVIIVAVPSALSASYNYHGEGPVAVALAVKNEQFWFTRVVRENNDWMIEGAPHLADASSADLHGVKALLADRFLPGPMRRRCDSEKIAVVESQFSAEACLAAGQRLRRSEKPTDHLALSPLYARVPEAVSIWENRRKSKVT